MVPSWAITLHRFRPLTQIATLRQEDEVEQEEDPEEGVFDDIFLVDAPEEPEADMMMID